jgi:hypothetical protein
MMRVVLLAACSANVVAILQRPANLADGSTGAEGHADERAPNNDAPTSRSLLFATVPQKMTYSSGTVVPTQGPGAPPSPPGFLPLVNWQKGVKCWAPDGSNEVRFKGPGVSFTDCAAKCTEDDKCTHFTHQSDDHCTTRKGCAELRAVQPTETYTANSYEKGSSVPLLNWQKGVKCWGPGHLNQIRFKSDVNGAPRISFTDCAAKCAEDDKCTHFTHQSDNHCTTRKGCAHLKAVPTTTDYGRADSYEKLPTCSSAPKPQGQQLAPGKTTCACQERSAGKDNVCTSPDCSDCFEPMTCGCPPTDYTFKSNVEATDVCGTNCDNQCFEIDNDYEYEDPSICASKEGRIAISDIYADRRDELASQQTHDYGPTGKTIHQTVTEIRAMQSADGNINRLIDITGIWCYMLADCTSPQYNREQHGPCVDNCELFYTQNPGNCRQRLCSSNHNAWQFKGRCEGGNPFYCPDE